MRPSDGSVLPTGGVCAMCEGRSGKKTTRKRRELCEASNSRGNFRDPSRATPKLAKPLFFLCVIDRDHLRSLEGRV